MEAITTPRVNYDVCVLTRVVACLILFKSQVNVSLLFTQEILAFYRHKTT